MHSDHDDVDRNAQVQPFLQPRSLPGGQQYHHLNQHPNDQKDDHRSEFDHGVRKHGQQVPDHEEEVSEEEHVCHRCVELPLLEEDDADEEDEVEEEDDDGQHHVFIRWKHHRGTVLEGLDKPWQAQTEGDVEDFRSEYVGHGHVPLAHFCDEHGGQRVRISFILSLFPPKKTKILIIRIKET